MKPVCTIYWLKDGEEMHRDFYGSSAAQFFIDGLKRENVCYWICWTSLNAKLVLSRSERFIETREMVG